jgi:hypothetical protein
MSTTANAVQGILIYTMIWLNLNTASIRIKSHHGKPVSEEPQHLGYEESSYDELNKC